MDIIKTDIVDPATDVFWDNVSTLTDNTTKRPVLIVINSYSQAGTDELQLRKMLDVCDLKQEQYNIVQLDDEQKAGWHRLREELDPKFIFLIGVTPAQLGINAMFQLHMPNNFNDRVWLPTLSLSELEEQPAVKKQLWMSGMKPIFKDKIFGEIS